MSTLHQIAVAGLLAAFVLPSPVRTEEIIVGTKAGVHLVRPLQLPTFTDEYGQVYEPVLVEGHIALYAYVKKTGSETGVDSFHVDCRMSLQDITNMEIPNPGEAFQACNKAKWLQSQKK